MDPSLRWDDNGACRELGVYREIILTACRFFIAPMPCFAAITSTVGKIP